MPPESAGGRALFPGASQRPAPARPVILQKHRCVSRAGRVKERGGASRQSPAPAGRLAVFPASDRSPFSEVVSGPESAPPWSERPRPPGQALLLSLPRAVGWLSLEQRGWDSAFLSPLLCPKPPVPQRQPQPSRPGPRAPWARALCTCLSSARAALPQITSRSTPSFRSLCKCQHSGAAVPDPPVKNSCVPTHRCPASRRLRRLFLFIAP